MNKLFQAAEKAIKHSLRLRKGESFLLVTDKNKIEIAESLAYWAKEVGAETTTYLMTENLRPITKPTKLLMEIAKKATAITYMLEARIEEKSFRSYLVKVGIEHSRICMMPGLTREMMERLVNIDFKAMDTFTKKVIKALKDADDICIENPQGTRIEFSVKGRKWINDNGDISRKGKHGNLPAGECFTAPVEEAFCGRLVISLIDDKLGQGIMEFDKGKLVQFRGKGIEAIIKNIGEDESGRIIGEFGIGTNPYARVTPNLLEAEKAFGTVHFAIGDSYGLGKNKSRHHYDALVNEVTIKAKGKLIAKNGKFLI
ncbi:MAG: aminopeptidase [Candidatus Aminicenantaceae bacterium]